MRLFDFLDYQASTNGDTLFLSSDARELTYRDGNDETVKLASLMLSHGIGAGDRVAILSKNSIEYILYYYACSRIGAVCVPLNFRLNPNEWRYILDDSQTKMVLCASEYLADIANLADDLPTLEKIMLLDDTADHDSDDVFCHYKEVHQVDLALAQNQVSQRQVSLTEDDIVYQMYTSGTTGSPKGVVISHRNISATVHQLALNTPQILLGGEWILILPVFHAAAALHCFSGVQSAATLHVKAEFVPQDFVDTLQNKRINVALAVPAIIKAVLAFVPNISSYDFSALELFIYGASPIDKATLTQAMDVFSCDFCQGYGMTESTLAITMLRPDDHVKAVEGRADLLASAGKPVFATQISIMNENDQPVAPKTVGEICVRGPQVMSSYWNLPEETESALRNGWLHTGDAGYLDESGYLFIVDRIKDMIISGGENIFPKEIENVLLQHEQIKDVAVVGVPDEKWGESAVAFVVPHNADEFDSEVIDAYCRSNLATYKCPKLYETLEELPMNATGKVLKKELRKPYWRNKETAIC